MRFEQYENDETIELTIEIRTSISIKENRILVKKKRSESRYKLKEVRIEIIISNIHEIWETTVYKELPRRFTP